MPLKEIKKVLLYIEDEINNMKKINIDEMLLSKTQQLKSRGLKMSIENEVHINNIDKYLNDSSPFVRASAIEAYVNQEGIDEKIIQLLDDPSEKVRSVAVKFITLSGSANKELKEKISSDQSSKVRKMYIETLIDESISEDELKPFENDPNKMIQDLANAFLGNFEITEENLSSLNKKLKKIAIIKKLKNFDENDIEYLQELLNKYRDLSNIESIIEAISLFPEDLAKNKLKEIIRDGSGKKRIFALKQMKKNIGYDNELIPTAEKLINSKDEDERVLGVQIFKSLKEPSTADDLRKLLKDPSEKVRSSAIDTLSSMMDYMVEDEVEDALNSTSTLLKKSALRAVKKLKLQDFESEILNLAFNHLEENATRIIAVGLCGFFKYNSAIENLEKIISERNSDGKLKLISAKALARIAPERLIEIYGV
jgi:HEAT repeat protein